MRDERKAWSLSSRCLRDERMRESIVDVMVVVVMVVVVVVVVVVKVEVGLPAKREKSLR